MGSCNTCFTNNTCLFFFYYFYFFLILIYINVNINNNNNNDGGVAAHCCGIFSCTNPPVWPVGGVVVAVTAFLLFLHHIIVFHGFSLFLIFFDGFKWFWKGLGGFGKGGEGWGGVFYYYYFFFINININININNDNDNNDNDGGIAAHCCGIFSCTNPPVWPVGGGGGWR